MAAPHNVAFLYGLLEYRYVTNTVYHGYCHLHLSLAGPLLNDNLHVRDIPGNQRKDLAVHLCGKV